MSHMQTMIKYVIDEIQSLKSITYDEPTIDVIIEILRNANGKIITSGVGKAALAAQKMAASLCSVGRPAIYLHPCEAMHGDSGIVSPGDVIVTFSNSGKTDELVTFMKHSREWKPSATLLITSNSGAEGKISQFVTHIITYGDINESCPTGMAPTGSLLAMIITADAIIASMIYDDDDLMQKFATFHHGGYIGQIINGGEE